MMNEEESNILAGLSSSDNIAQVRRGSQATSRRQKSSKYLQKRNSTRSILNNEDNNKNDGVFQYAESKYVRSSNNNSPIQSKTSNGSTSTSMSTSSTRSDEEEQGLLNLQQQDNNGGLQIPSSTSRVGDILDQLSYQDVFDVEEEFLDEAKNFERFGESANGKPKRSYFRSMLRGCLQNKSTMAVACLVHVGVIIVICSIAAAGGFKSSSDEVAPLEIQQVPPAPSTLSMICQASDSNSRNTLNVPETCFATCNKAECCWNPNGNFECSKETKSRCPAYVEPCAIMMEKELEHEAQTYVETVAPGITEMAVHPAPSGMVQECRRDENGNLSEYCQEQCAQSECCWSRTTPYTCTFDTVHNCGIYKSLCSFMNSESYEQFEKPPKKPNNLPFPPAPTGIGFFCDPTHMGDDLDVCHAACAEAECCWKNGVESCVDSVPDEACKHYTFSCNIWNEREGNGASTPATETETTTEAVTPVETTPETATTTDAPATPNTPAGHSDTDSMATAAAPVPIPTAPDDLVANCAFVSLTTPEGKAECQRHCSKAECCWVPDNNADGIVPCKEESVCDAYAPCQVLIGVGDGQGVSPVSPSSPNQTPAAEDTTVTETETTPETTATEPEVDTSNNVAGVGSDETVDTSNMSDEEKQIFDACSGNFERSHCLDMCKPGTCCFDSTMQCEDSFDCSMYSTCSVLGRRNLRSSEGPF